MSKRLFKGLNKEQAGGEGVLYAIKNKIRSREGASITFALLIFLVCAIISGVVIVAGSTASGRMSQIAQTDQRYYAVTSAAGLLRDDIDGTRVTASYELDASGAYKEGTAKAIKVESIETGASIPLENRKILEYATCQMALKNESQRLLTLEVQNYATLKCSISENVKPKDGQVIYQISNIPPESATNKAVYTLQIIFIANISESKAQGLDADGNSITIVTTVVEWTFAGVKKGAQPTTV